MAVLSSNTVKNVVIVLLLAGLAVALLWPRPVPKPSIPTIVTQYDTVTVVQFKHDTAWLTRLKRDTVTVTNLVERIVTTKPDTIRVPVGASFAGIGGIKVGERIADTTRLLTFRLAPTDTVGEFHLQSLEYDYYTPGPLASVVLTTAGVPVVRFYPPPATCSLKCRAEYAAGGALVVTLIRALLGR